MKNYQITGFFNSSMDQNTNGTNGTSVYCSIFQEDG